MHPRRCRLLCEVCGKRGGAPIQCSFRTCGTAFHALCGRAAGRYMSCEQRQAQPRQRRPRGGKGRWEEDELADAAGKAGVKGEDEDGVVMLAYCAKHTPSHAAAAETVAGAACKVCGSEGDGEHMLLCEDCDAPYHTVRAYPHTQPCMHSLVLCGSTA